jgi:phosphoribosylamine--glycine ligase
VEWSTDACVGVFLTSGGYPEAFETGFPIAGLNTLDEDVLIFHAGTTNTEDGSVVTAGGRVLTIVATGPTLQDARAKAYRNVQRLHFSRAYYRHDIAAPSQDARTD